MAQAPLLGAAPAGSPPDTDPAGLPPGAVTAGPAPHAVVVASRFSCNDSSFIQAKVFELYTHV